MEKTFTLKVFTAGVSGQWIMVEQYSGLKRSEYIDFMDGVFAEYEHCECIVTPEK